MTTNAPNKTSKLPLPLKSPVPAPPRKRYPVNHSLGHGHPYEIARNRIHALECSNKQLLEDNDNLEKKVRDLSAKLHELSAKAFEVGGNAVDAVDAIIKFKDENSQLSTENLYLRKLALHGLIYHLDYLIGEENAKGYPNVSRIRRWTEERMRFTIAYERIKGSKG
jgi:hypothetical protein